MGRCQRPICTSVLVFCWLAMFFGTILMHAALGTLIPAITDLPSNLIKGFGEVLKFDLLADSVKNVKSHSAAAVNGCNEIAVTRCPQKPSTDECQSTPRPQWCQPSNKYNADDQNTQITAQFDNALGVIQTVANDKYLGSGMNGTAAQLNDIKKEMKDAPKGDVECIGIVPVYCEIYNSAVELEKLVDEVNKEIDKMENSEAMDMFNDNADKLSGLNFLPWIMMLALGLYTCFWWCSNGTCCCCSDSGGKCAPTLLLIPHTLFCLLFFVIIMIFCAIGFILPQFPVDNLEGKPTVEEIMDHIETTYPDFYDLVFKELIRGLGAFRGACFVLLVSTLLTVIYAVCVCLVRPYKPKEAAEKSSS